MEIKWLYNHLEQGEEKPNTSKDFLETVLDNLRDCLFVADPANFTILAANKAFVNSYGQGNDTVVGKHCYELTHNRSTPCSSPDHICPIVETLKTSKPSTVEHIHYDSTGSKLYFEISVIPIISEGGGIHQIIHLSRDITGRKRAEEEIKQNLARLKSLASILQYHPISTQDFLDHALDEAIQLTGSQVGYIYYYKEEEREFVLSSWSKDVMKECTITETQTLYELDKTGIWGEAVRQRQAIVVNNFHSPNPLKKGYPEGHVQLHRFMTVPIFSGDRIIAVIGVANKESDYTETDVLQLTLLMDAVWKVVDRTRAQDDLQATLEKLRLAARTTIQVMAFIVETRDPYTSGHQVRSAHLSRAIATEMGLSQDKIDEIWMASYIHDIGKLATPAEVLSKPTKLSEIEFDLIKEHSRRGYEILKNVESPWPLAEITYQHHERMDGSGYPRNLKGEEICIEARILAVADVVESMASHRPYRPALGMDVAMEEIEKNKGILYDQDVAEACLRLIREKGFRLDSV